MVTTKAQEECVHGKDMEFQVSRALYPRVSASIGDSVHMKPSLTCLVPLQDVAVDAFDVAEETDDQSCTTKLRMALKWKPKSVIFRDFTCLEGKVESLIGHRVRL